MCNFFRVALSKSFVLSTTNMEEGMAFANQYAPEHLILNVELAGRLALLRCSAT